MSMWQKSMQSTHTANVINSRKYAIWMLYIHFDWTDPISLWGKPICQLLRFFLISLVQFVYSDHNENDIRFQTFCTVLCARKNEDTRCTYSVFAVTFHRVPVLLDIHRNALRKTFQFFSLFRGQLCPAPDDLVFSIEFCSSPILVYPSWLYSLLSNATVFFSVAWESAPCFKNVSLFVVVVVEGTNKMTTFINFPEVLDELRCKFTGIS